MKTNHQPPRPKHQRNSKPQAAKKARPHRLALTYPFVASTSVFLNEIPDGPATSKHPFDLEERTARFGEAIVQFSKKIPRDPANNRLIDQLVGAGTSIGGNYCEATREFRRETFIT